MGLGIKYSKKGWLIMPHQELVEKLDKIKDIVKFMDEKGIHGKERGKSLFRFTPCLMILSSTAVLRKRSHYLLEELVFCEI